jgi:serine/threonine protein phosphatase PrpC
VSQAACGCIASALAKKAGADDMAGVLWDTFCSVNAFLVGESGIDCTFSGATATVSVLSPSHITSAWVGDSRAVLGRREDGAVRAYDLTNDHKPDLPEETARIVASGGRVEPLLVRTLPCRQHVTRSSSSATWPGAPPFARGAAARSACTQCAAMMRGLRDIRVRARRVQDELNQPLGPPRVWLADSWMPGLAMSRSLGDTLAASCGVTSCPDVSVVDLTPADVCVVWASDGVWEFMSSQDAVDAVVECADAAEAAAALVRAAQAHWRTNEVSVSDDISCIVALLNTGASSTVLVAAQAVLGPAAAADAAAATAASGSAAADTAASQ